MALRHLAPLLLAGFASSNLRADVTITLSADVQSLQPIPMGLKLEPFGRSSGSSLRTTRVKGNQCLSSSGSSSNIIDLSKQDVTLMDGVRKIYTTVSLAKYGEIVAASAPKPSPEAQATVKMKTTTSVRHTGRTDSIYGIEAEEREITMLVETEITAAGAPLSGPLMRFVIQVWTAKHEEMVGRPALRELADFSAVRNTFANPIEMLQKVATSFTGSSEGMTAVVDEIKKGNSIVLREVSEVYLPILGAAFEKLAALRGQPLSAGFDANAPFSRMTTEVVEFSTAALDDAVFQIPPDYTAAMADEFLKGAKPVH